VRVLLKVHLLILAVCCAQLADAYPAKRRTPVSRPASLDVAPSPEIDARVSDEIAKARQILESMSPNNLFASSYLVSAFYYHEGFLDDFPVNRNSAAPERRIIGQISKSLTADDKARFLRLLRELWTASGATGPERAVEPVAWRVMSGPRNHKYAVDLFAAEGSPVSSVSRGVVVLADKGWNAEDLFSTASRKGGNAVIVFDPDHDRLYRYCHLSTATVSAGQVVAAGETLGTVGHTGLNASRAGHGRHLHFEANEIVAGRVRAMAYPQLRAMLRKWRAPAAAAGYRMPRKK
jgi:murein DD-endopeptidase MepM/ murein hydrolase activator NlpD